MREIKIIRPKRMEAAAMSLIVEVDGRKEGKLTNGKEITVQVDEGSHELYLHGGMMAGKNFNSKLTIPSGRFSYIFRVDMLTVTNGNYKPVLNPSGEVPLKDTHRTNILHGMTLTAVLLDEKLRAGLAKLPEAYLQLLIAQNEWAVAVCQGNERSIVVKQPYSQTTGGLMALTLNTIEHGDLQTPEGRAKYSKNIFERYINTLPDYEQIGENTFRFIG